MKNFVGFTLGSFFLLSLFLTVPVMTSSFTAASCAINGVIHDWGMLNGFAGLHPTRTLVRLAGAVLRDYLRE